MIFNRTQKDVKDSQHIVENFVQKGSLLTDEQKAILARGTVTTETLNRIESKQEEIKKRLNDMGYFSTSIENKQWLKGDWFFDEDLKRIVKNNSILRKAFFVYKSTPTNAIAKYHYEEFNRLERILFDLESVMSYVENNYKICGTFNCGG